VLEIEKMGVEWCWK